MKTIFSHLALLILALFSLSSARAALDSAVVSADAQWVVSVDLNGLRASTIGKELITASQKMNLNSNEVNVSVDLPKLMATVGSVTAYGANFAADPKAIDGILVIKGTPDLRKIAEAALVQATVTTPEKVSEFKDLPFPAYSVSSGAVKDVEPMQVIVAFPPESAVLVGKSKAQLLKARDVLRGSAPSLAQSPTSALNPLLQNAGSAYIFAASVVPSDKTFMENAPQARILQMANSGSVSVGESGPLTFAHVELMAGSDDMADKLVKILQGITAMMSLAESSDKDLTAFLNSATVAKTDRSVTLHLAYDSERIVQMAKNLQEQQAASSGRGPANGRIVADWKLNEQAADADGLAWKTAENVHLVNGTMVTILARPTNGHHVRLDRVEIAPAAGGAPLVFRGEYMRLVLWAADTRPTAAGGKPIVTRTPGATARFQFPGADGNYTVKIAYEGETDNATSLIVSAKDPVTTLPATAATPTPKVAQ